MEAYEGTMGYKLIYVFTIHDGKHEGRLKIGEHTFNSASSYKQLQPNCEEMNRAARERINQYTKEALIEYDLLYTELARRPVILRDGTRDWAAFSDHDVHKVLYASDCFPLKFSDSERDTEWFSVDLQTAIRAIQAVNCCPSN